MLAVNVMFEVARQEERVHAAVSLGAAIIERRSDEANEEIEADRKGIY